MKIIYDVGANNGDDISYYLLKADKVVAIEANPALCKTIYERFKNEVACGKLSVENCALVADEFTTEADFYLHNTHHVLSQLPRPAEAEMQHFSRVVLPAKSLQQLICVHGKPYYIKIDIERYDQEILRMLFSSGTYPEYISAEAHSAEVFALLAGAGPYNAFKLVDGASVASLYKNRTVHAESGQDPVEYSFPTHSAGPFGEDIDGEWMSGQYMLRLLAIVGLGWKDIHASKNAVPGPRSTIMNDVEFFKRVLRALDAKLTVPRK